MSFSNDNGEGKENVKTALGLLSKTTSLHVHHAFLYMSLSLLHNHDVKMPNFTFHGGFKQATTKFSLNLNAVPKKSTPGKLAYIRHFHCTGINPKFEKMLIHSKRDVFTAVTIINAKTP